jgi:hypothetical protein
MASVAFDIAIYMHMPDLTEIQKAILKQTLEELCGQFGITLETDVSGMKLTDSGAPALSMPVPSSQ